MTPSTDPLSIVALRLSEEEIDSSMGADTQAIANAATAKALRGVSLWLKQQNSQGRFLGTKIELAANAAGLGWPLERPETTSLQQAP